MTRPLHLFEQLIGDLGAAVREALVGILRRIGDHLEQYVI